jgi:hypothetical protein
MVSGMARTPRGYGAGQAGSVADGAVVGIGVYGRT